MTYSSFHLKLTCYRHDISGNCWIGVKQQSFTHSKCSMKPLFNRRSKLDFRLTVQLSTRGWCESDVASIKICKSTYYLDPSPPAIALKHLTSLLPTQLCLTLSWRTNSRHTYGYKLCSCSRRLVPLFIGGRLHTWASTKTKEANPIL